MQLHYIFFSTIFKVIILATTKADIPGCHFWETVNVSSSQSLQNSSYLYPERVVPLNLIGEYNNKTTKLGYYDNTETHLRRCVCHLKPCLWICCRFKDWDASNGKCTDGLMEELVRNNPFLNVTLSNGTVVKRNLIKDFIVLRDRMRVNEGWKEDEYILFENGTVFLRSNIYIDLSSGYNCLHPNQFSSDNREVLVVAFHDNFFNMWRMSPGASELIWVSEVFLILTITVYFFVKKLRNLHGKCFICYMIASFIFFIHLVMEPDEVPLQLCALYAYSSYFSWTAKLTWLLTLSHQMWKSFTSLNRAESQHSFRAYSVFAWGTAALLTGTVFLIDSLWNGMPSNVNWVPGIGWQNCDVKDGWSYQAYIHFPFDTLIALNTVLLIWSTISIIKVKLSLKYFSDRGDTARNLSSRIQTYTMYVRLFIVMDIQWSLRLISYYAKWYNLLDVCKYFNYCIGIIIFVLFILKPSTIRLLIESISNRSQ